MGVGATIKDWVRRASPRGYSTLQRVRNRVFDELRILARVGTRGLVRLWRSRVAVQLVSEEGQPLRSLSLAGRFRDLTALLDAAATAGVAVSGGAHAVYLSPDALARLGISDLLKWMPAGLGIKLLRNAAESSERYVHGPTLSVVQDRLIYSARGLMTLANALALEGVGPRVVDCTVLAFDSGAHLALLVQHVPSAVRSDSEFQEGLGRIQTLLAAGEFRLLEPAGLKGADFATPDGNGNLRVDESGRVLYVDPQNFVFADYPRFLRDRASRWVEASHFGDAPIIRGGKYLYQSVPGAGRSAKRDTADREARYRALLAKAGASLDAVAVFDIGCNIGRMSAFALREGALWAHLWDRTTTAEAARESLLLTGFSRFSVTGAELKGGRPLLEDLPTELRGFPAARGVVFYLAIHHHVGWLEGLRTLPWRFMLFEGPEGISDEALAAAFADLGRLARVQVVATAWGGDGDSAVRPYCVLERVA